MTARLIQSAGIILVVLASTAFSADVPEALESGRIAAEEDAFATPFLMMEFDSAPLIAPDVAYGATDGQFGEGDAADVPVVVNDRVEWFIRYFQTDGRWFFVKWLERSTRYLPMIREILRENGLPEDLAYLALIESGFSPYAKSQAKAVGMWQFMQWTARVNGLRIDWWIDERRNPEKATRAAARHLGDLYGKFGSWHLAAAGYNGGEGRIRRALRDYPAEDFWTLANYKKAMKRETRDYVPKYMAAMLIAKNPEAYGFYDMDYQEPVLHDTAAVPFPTDLKVIAEASGATLDEVRELNPELLRWFTPPDYPDYEIKVPYGTGEAVALALSALSPAERLEFLTHKVKKGETLSQIAKRYATDVGPIMELNNIKNARGVRAGSVITIPLSASRGAVAKPGPNMPAGGIYVVRKGDTLWDISSRFNIDLDLLLEWNGLRGTDTIMPGARILLKEASLGAVRTTRLR